MLFRHEEDRSPGRGLQQPHPTPLEFDLKIGVESVQLLLRQVIDGAPWQLLAVEELDGHVLQIVTGHRL